MPAVGLPRATPVTFTLAPDLIRTPAGGGLDAAYTTSVRPAPLAVWSVRQAAAATAGTCWSCRSATASCPATCWPT